MTELPRFGGRRFPHLRLKENSMRGRKPVPTRLKLLTGSPGKRALNHDEPRPVSRSRIKVETEEVRDLFSVQG